MMIPSKNDQILIQKILVNPSPIYFINNKITKKKKRNLTYNLPIKSVQ